MEMNNTVLIVKRTLHSVNNIFMICVLRVCLFFFLGVLNLHFKEKKNHEYGNDL